MLDEKSQEILVANNAKIKDTMARLRSLLAECHSAQRVGGKAAA